LTISSGRLMDLPKADRILCRNSGDQPDRDQDERQSEITRPQGRRCHGCKLARYGSPNLVA
jgi:hypothetical protein